MRIKYENKNKIGNRKGVTRKGERAVGKRHIAREGYRTFPVDSPPGTVPCQCVHPGKSRRRPNQSIISQMDS